MKKSNKKLNKKGFTLIELLAVIVILAVILAVTIPSVLNSMSKARENSLQNAADSVADWFAKNYELDAIGTYGGGADAAYTTFVKENSAKTLISGTGEGTDENQVTPWTLTTDVLTAAGISNADTNIEFSKTIDNNTTNLSTVYYNTTKNRVCVVLQAKEGGSFYNNKDKNANTKSSSGC